MSLRKVSAGQPFRMSASDFNAFIDAAQAVQASGQRLGGEPLGGIRDRTVVLVRNESGFDLPQFVALGVVEPLVLPSDNPQAFAERIAVRGILPDATMHRTSFVILQEPIAAGAIGRALAVGVTPVRLQVMAASDTSASITTGSGTLTTGKEGATRILWKEAGTGFKWGIISLPADGGAGLGSAASVLGRSAASDGARADIPAVTDDSALLRVAGTLQWLTLIPRMKFGGVVGGRVQFVGTSSTVSHEYEVTATTAVWKQFRAGSSRWYWNTTDFWEIAPPVLGGVIEIVSWVAGVAKHRIVLDAAVNLGGAPRTLTLREFDICENGVAKKVALLASAPY